MSTTIGQPIEGIHHPAIFRDVASFLAGLAEKEILHGHMPAFTQWKSKSAAFKAQFKHEFLAYARHQYPFNLPIDETLRNGVEKWWMALVGIEGAKILPVGFFAL
jgi:hypothetical protein